MIEATKQQLLCRTATTTSNVESVIKSLTIAITTR
jgi:hypothetical protein